MKFITRKGAPDIPLELIVAQETDNLVFFCGAGVSYSAGLPSFADLVEKVYSRLNTIPTELEEEAKKAGLYDRTLSLLEQRFLRNDRSKHNLVKSAIIEELEIKDDANLQNHKILLELSKTKSQNSRLVTTNVDHGFKVVGNQKCIIDAAPKLPVPKPHKWESVVHLHGIIDNSDPNGDKLIFTSGDFGSAYLTERWASRFVTDLFSHFTVLFIGYSVNDPVIRYMTDAIAAERFRGDKIFKKPYVIIKTKPSQRLADENSWVAKGIDPIFYENSHGNLYNTLQEWSKYIEDGLNAKIRIITKEALKPPLPPYEHDDGVTRLLEVLREKIGPNDATNKGLPAKVFKELDPPAPIEWLPVFHEKKLLSIARNDHFVTPVNSSPIESNLLNPNPISYNLWFWLTKHLETKVLVHWVIDQGACLHPVLKKIISKHIQNNTIQEPYLKFWKLITSSYVYRVNNFDREGYRFIRNFRKGVDQLSLKEFSKALEPAFKFSKSINLEDDEFPKISHRPPYDIEIVIGLSKWTYEELTKFDSYPEKFIRLLLPATQSLIKTVELFEYIGLFGEKYDRSHWHLPSISPHEQNKRYRSWVILVELCRDLWSACWKKDQKQAKIIFGIWRSTNRPIFRRLVLYCMTVKDILDSEHVIDYLLEDDGWWLWATETQREVYRLLNKYWPKLDKRNTKLLIKFILNGPPKNMFPEDLEKDRWEQIFENDIWLKLSKLESFDRALPTDAMVTLHRLEQKYPEWKLRDNEKDEFSSWMETGFGHKVDIKIEDLFEMDVQKLVRYLVDENNEYRQGRIDLFRNGGKEYGTKVILSLEYLKGINNWDEEIWHAGLMALAKSSVNSWDKIAPFLCEADKRLYMEESWAIAYWTKECLPKEGSSTSSNYFEIIFNAILDSEKKSEEKITEPVDYAINNPIGIITEALLTEFNKYDLKVNSGIPKSLLNLLAKLLPNDITAFKSGKIIIASRLNYLYTLDPKWSETNLIPLFDWASPKIAMIVWHGYLWNPRISIGLAVALKEYFTDTIKHLIEFDDSRVQILAELFVIICLEYSNVFKIREQQKILIEFGTDGLEYIAQYFDNSLNKDSITNNKFWVNRIRPFIQKAWPKEANLITARTSRFFSTMLPKIDDSFIDAFYLIRPYLMPFSDLHMVLYNLNNSELPEKEPTAVFQLISIVFMDEYYPSELFRKVLDRIKNAEPKITKEESYKRINNYLIQFDQ